MELEGVASGARPEEYEGATQVEGAKVGVSEEPPGMQAELAPSPLPQH